MNDDREIWDTYAKGVRSTKAVSKKLISKLRSHEKQNLKTLLARKSEKNSITKQIRGKSSADISNLAVQKKPQPQFTKKVERSLREGSLIIDAKLDLHGMTQAEAFAALERFVGAQIKAGHRNLLIITGKGSLGKSVLRSNLPLWLEILPGAEHILSLRPASPKHGGSGAFYVFLKRRRD